MTKTCGPYRIQKNFSVITVPEEVREKLGLQKGDLVIWIVDDEGHCILKKVEMKVET